MPFVPQKRARTPKSHKSVYLPQDLLDRVEQLAAQTGHSFNHLVQEMIAYCMQDLEQQKKNHK